MDDAAKDSAVRGALLASNIGDQSTPATVGSILRVLTMSPKSQSRTMQSVGGGGGYPMQPDVEPRNMGAVSTVVLPLSSPAQMPSLVASFGAGGPSSWTSTSPAAANHGPPLLVRQCPIDPVDDPAAAASPALSTDAAVDKAPRSDTDSDTLSAHSPAPVLVPASSTPPPTNAASSSLHLKKTWLLRYSDEDRKSATAATDNFRSAADSYDKSQDGAGAGGVDEKPAAAATEPWTTVSKQTTVDRDDEESTPDSDATQTSSEKQQRPEMTEKKASGKGGVRETEDAKITDGKDSIKNCFINCTYLSDKDQEARSLRRIKDSALEDKDSQSSTSKESDDSQVDIEMF